MCGCERSLGGDGIGGLFEQPHEGARLRGAGSVHPGSHVKKKQVQRMTDTHMHTDDGIITTDNDG